MSDNATADVSRDALLDWEDLGSGPAGRAFVRSLWELLARPPRFFDQMALSGGLHEPATFFAAVLTAAVLLGFAVALCWGGLVSRAPSGLAQATGTATSLLPRVAAVALVLLPQVLLAGWACMVVLGTLFFLAARLFGVRGWEGTVAVCLYSAAAGLVPLVIALACTLGVLLAGVLAGLVAPGAGAAMLPVVRWTWRVLGGLAALGPLAVMPIWTGVGCARAFRLDVASATAAAVAGWSAVWLVIGVCTWAFIAAGAWRGVACACACAAALVGMTAIHLIRARTALGSE